MSLSVRPARREDLPDMSRVLIASITLLCAEDHKNDPDVIAAWTANKDEAGVRQMLANDDCDLYVAERDGAVVGVCASIGDAIVLNHVDPAHRRSGVSRAMIHTLERVLKQRNVEVAQLKSTATAKTFYVANGWTVAGPPKAGRFISAIPMRKTLID